MRRTCGFHTRHQGANAVGIGIATHFIEKVLSSSVLPRCDTEKPLVDAHERRQDSGFAEDMNIFLFLLVLPVPCSEACMLAIRDSRHTVIRRPREWTPCRFS